MKKFDPNEKLLEDIFCDDRFAERNARTRALALRRLHDRTRLSKVMPLVSMLLVGALGALLWRGIPMERGSQGEVQTPLATASIPPTNTPPTARLISDDELLALFPPDSCAIAEVDGKVMLVFLDPAVEQAVRVKSDPNL